MPADLMNARVSGALIGSWVAMIGSFAGWLPPPFSCTARVGPAGGASTFAGPLLPCPDLTFRGVPARSWPSTELLTR